MMNTLRLFLLFSLVGGMSVGVPSAPMSRNQLGRIPAGIFLMPCKLSHYELLSRHQGDL